MKKSRFFVFLALVLAAVIALSGCTVLMGKDGKVYGSYDWPSFGMQTLGLHTTGGFPGGSTYYPSEYLFSDGSYYFQYQLYDSNNYYVSYAYTATYVVSHNKGAFLKDAVDKHFEVYCDYYGATISGLSKVGPAPDAKALAAGEYTQSFSDGTITVTLNVKRSAAIDKSDSESNKK